MTNSTSEPPQGGGIAEVEGLAFDFENEGILLAEKASSWRGDWCDYAMLAENVLKEAHEAGRAAQATELSRLSTLVKAQKEALERLDDAICQVKKGLSRKSILAVNGLDRAGLDLALVAARRARGASQKE